MAKKDKRFIVTERQGSELGNYFQVIVDKNTGVNYLWVKSGYSGGLTPLLDCHGNVVVTPVTNLELLK